MLTPFELMLACFALFLAVCVMMLVSITNEIAEKKEKKRRKKALKKSLNEIEPRENDAT